MMDANELFSLKWNDYNTEMINSFHKLRTSDQYTDVTLACENRQTSNLTGFKKFRLFKAHKLLLCVASPYFRDVIVDNPCTHPVIIIRETFADELEAILQFIYAGQVQIRQDFLDRFIKAAKFLHIRGLVKVKDDEPCVKDDPDATPEAGMSSGNGTEKKHRPPPKRKPYRENVVDNDSDDPDFEIRKLKPAPSSVKKIRIAQKKSSDDVSGNEETRQLQGDDGDVMVCDDFVATCLDSDQESTHSLKPPCPVAAKKTTSTSSGQYECKYCDRTYSVMSSLLLHQQVHSGATTCKICGKVLSRVFEMRKHMEKIHGYAEPEDDEVVQFETADDFN